MDGQTQYMAQYDFKGCRRSTQVLSRSQLDAVIYEIARLGAKNIKETSWVVPYDPMPIGISEEGSNTGSQLNG